MSAVPPLVTQTTTPPPIIIQQLPPGSFWLHRWFVRLLMIALIFSLAYSARLNSEYRMYFQQTFWPMHASITTIFNATKWHRSNGGK